jgi:quinol monooxygenase YgiN
LPPAVLEWHSDRDNVGRARKAVKIAAPEVRRRMPTSPWRSQAQAEPGRLYVALLSYLPLASSGRIPGFLLHTARIVRQLQGSRGLLGYSLRAELMAKRFWTLSAWQDEASLHDFVDAGPHARAMAALRPHMGVTRFIRWTVEAAQLPLDWEDALSRWRED